MDTTGNLNNLKIKIMSNIETFTNKYLNQNPISYAKKESYTEKVEAFVIHLHAFKEVIKQEFDDLEKKAEVKPCKAFDDKMAALSAIYQAEKDLYYWYVENKKRQA